MDGEEWSGVMASGRRMQARDAPMVPEASLLDASAYVSESRSATPDSVRWARDLVVQFAVKAGVPETRLEDIRLLVSEAVTNAVLHAYGTPPGEVHVIAAVASDEFWVVIADDGEGMRTQPGETGGLGLGLALMARLSSDLTIGTRSSGGVEVRMGFDLASTADADVSCAGL
jgi:anti-sigma regulatory factor (Ser/Thr protein kinase)